MAKIYVKIKIMPKAPNSDLDKIKAEVEKAVDKDGSKMHKAEKIPIAFGLNSLQIVFMRDEDKGTTEKLEKQFEDISDVESVEVLDVRRAFG